MHSESNNIEIMTNDKTDEVQKELFLSITSFYISVWVRNIHER